MDEPVEVSSMIERGFSLNEIARFYGCRSDRHAYIQPHILQYLKSRGVVITLDLEKRLMSRGLLHPDEVRARVQALFPEYPPYALVNIDSLMFRIRVYNQEVDIFHLQQQSCLAEALAANLRFEDTDYLLTWAEVKKAAKGSKAKSVKK